MTIFKVFSKGRVSSPYKLKDYTKMSSVKEKEIFENHKYPINGVAKTASDHQPPLT